LSRLMTPRRTLRIDAQELRGTCIVTRCTDQDLATECFQPLAYWRDNSQFASTLGVDVSRIQRAAETNPHRHWQAIVAGSGEGFDCCARYPGPARYVISEPNGSVVRRGETANASTDSPLKRIDWWQFHIFREGSRTLVFLPTHRFGEGR